MDATLEQFLIVIGLTAGIMISPGPDMALVIRNTLTGGRRAGLSTSAGVLLGNAVHIGYCVAGVGLLIAHSVVAFNVLRYAGAAYLIYLGISGMRSTPQAQGQAQAWASAGPAPAGKARWFRQGLFGNLLNVKGTLFYLGVFTVVIAPETPAATTALLVAAMMTVSTLFWLAFVALLDRPFMRTAFARGEKLINRVLGGILVALGLRVALSTD